MVIGLLYSLTTGIIWIRLSPFSMTGPTLNSFSFTGLLLISGLTAILITLQYDLLRKKKTKGTKASFLGYFGTTGSFFTTTCPLCKPLLVTLFGIGGTAGLLQKYGLQITIISVLLLTVSIYFVARSTTNCCEVEKK